VHSYLGINIEKVWEIIETDFADFRRKLKGVLKNLDLPKTPPSSREKNKKGSKQGPKKPKKKPPLK
jgi:hypothetical protein